MAEQVHPIIRLLQEDRRYKLEAYQFVRDGLAFAQDILKLGQASAAERDTAERDDEDDEPPVEKHLTGQELCEAIRLYAIDQYGLLAKNVLNSWGLHATSDFGEVVYNLIRVELMRKSKSDRREDFDNCYDFEHAFVKKFRISKGSK